MRPGRPNYIFYGPSLPQGRRAEVLIAQDGPRPKRLQYSIQFDGFGVIRRFNVFNGRKVEVMSYRYSICQ